ncbi:MAG: hypothetical protein KAG98_04980 [Lentisphaeria bacterium]|nr:hypothetical protein [Lentisphaeria bacterium]
MTIFSIGTVGLYGTMMVARSAQVAAKHRLLAIRLVNERLEELQQVSYGKISNFHNDGGIAAYGRRWTVDANDAKDYTGSFGGSFNAKIFTLVTAGDASVSFYNVQVYVNWTDPRSGIDRNESGCIQVY